MIKLNEIFYSVQGESSYAGYPTVFIRTTGCNLRCSYCDTTYAYHAGKPWEIDEILNEVEQYGGRHVCVTGGEPLLQRDVYELMARLCDQKKLVSLETSGSKSIENVDPRVKVILDIKTPDSGAPESFLMENLDHAQSDTEIKFVICSPEDFRWAEEFVRTYKLSTRFMVLYSPSFGAVDEKWLAEKILAENSPARLQLQLHKYIWSPHTIGV